MSSNLDSLYTVLSKYDTIEKYNDLIHKLEVINKKLKNRALDFIIYNAKELKDVLKYLDSETVMELYSDLVKVSAQTIQNAALSNNSNNK